MKKMSFNKKFKRTVTWMMAMVMSLSTVMGSMTVYANGNEINNYVEDLDLSKEYVDSSASEYHNDEAAAVAANSQSIQAMETQVEKAQAAATAAEAAVEEAKEAVATAETKSQTATTEAAEATTEAAGAKTAATEAQTTVDTLEAKNTAANVDTYNNNVAVDQAAVNEVEVTTTVTVDNGDGTTSEVTLEEYVDTKANEAQEAAEEAKAALEEALAVETEEVNDEVLAAVDKVNEAADKAAQAAKEAEDAKKAAEANQTAAIEEYNLYAMSYGLPLYGEKEVTYTAEVAKAAVEAAGMTYQEEQKASLQKEIDEINAADLADKKAAVDAAATAVATATTAATEAATAATTAAATAKAAQESINGYDETADDAANAVNNYYVTPAQKAVDTTNTAIEDKKTEITTLNTALESAKTTAKAAGEVVYNTELANKAATVANKEAAKNEKYQLWKDTPSWRVITKAIREAEYEAAKDDYNDAVSAYNNYNKQSTKDSVVNDYVANDSAVNTAQANVNAANAELGTLTEQYTKEANVLAAEEATRDAYIAAATQADADNAREKFVTDIKKILSNYSDEINQIDYDEDLNDWANDVFNTWHLIDKGVVRDEMNGKYVDCTLEDIFNTLGITQWMVDTDSAEDVMDEMRAAYRTSIEDYYEKLATAEANWAAMDTEAAKDAVEAEVTRLTAVNNTIAAANTAVSNANTELSEAQTTYENAEDELADLKEQVKDKKFDSITLEALQKKIAAAQKAVNAAADELKAAQAAKAAAENYADWANELVKEHYMRAYSQAIKDENNNLTPVTGNLKEYDTTNETVASRPTADFVCVTEGTSSIKVPYAIYKDYVEAMYDSYKFGKNGKGTSTGSNMDVIFWEIDENGVLTGKSYTSEADLTDGTYFVAYSFKKESDGYHLDGTMYEYTKPVDEGGSNDGGSNEGGADEGGAGEGGAGEGGTVVAQTEVQPAAQAVVQTVAQPTVQAAAQPVVAIEDEETPLAGDINAGDGEENDEEAIADEDVVTIEDEETPLASGIQGDGVHMSWWWLLILLLATITGYMMYKSQHDNKEKESEK